LSGIVLTGANQPVEPDRDDGVLTALEVGELDLKGVELVVLSACQTGLGQSAGGEGLLGLQRAFQVAGARSVVASLWSISDDATRALMIDFYDNLWSKGLSKIEALRQAQLTMLRHGIERTTAEAGERGLKLADEHPTSANHLPPYYWAAFVLSGAWE
jgi:CHAT domain-containing protein